MRSSALLAAFLASRVAGHPLCWDDTPTDLTQTLSYCSNDLANQASGVCCTQQDEDEIEAIVIGANIATTECENLYKEVSRLLQVHVIIIFT